MASGDNQQDKKGITGGFGLFLLAVMIAVMFLQNFFEAKSAKVSFSYQVEHLVNLNMLRQDDCKKTATHANLVSFSGKFQETLSDSSRQRFHYLELIRDFNDIKRHDQELQQRQKDLSVQALRAVNFYMRLKGDTLPATGLYIHVNSTEAQQALVLNEISKDPIPSLGQMTARWNQARADSKASGQFVAELIDWLGLLSSPNLGIAADSLKQQLRASLKELELLGDSRESSKVEPAVAKVLHNIEQVLSSLDDVEGDWRFIKLRSIRELRDIHQKKELVGQRLAQVRALLDKQRPLVKDVIWFFNNKELSAASLEQQEADEYAHWFERARAEWDRFPLNKSAFFKASDQPNYLVLERTFKSEEVSINYLGILFPFLPVILIGLLIYFMFARQAKGVGTSAMSFGKSPAKLLQKGTHKITFKDVAGIDEAKEELQEIVEFLKDPQRFTQLGAEIPKGVLCVGPPGTGKTLVAKAVAGEADRPFFSISGSDFVEMFVGVGASRIRDMFKEAKKQAPCIIFMDEIDAVGRHRGVGIGGGHDEREQTLNQLLVEMDGFDANEGIILMAATNRPDVLDKALLRPGRFDRRVTIDLPDVKGRFEILKLHAKKIKMAVEVDLMKVARATPGSSGADLKNVLNEAALRAVRLEHECVQNEDVDYATDKVRFGKERRSLEMTKEEINRTAYHEAGHAILGLVSKHCDPVEKVTVIPRGMSLGATYTLPKGNRVGYWKEELADIMAMVMGGRAAEEIFIGDISSGAQSDIQRVTQLARSMVCEWGMSSKLGQIAFEERSDNNMYLGGAHSTQKTFSEKTAQVIDEEVHALIKQAHESALEVLSAHKEQGQLMAEMLMEFETLDAQDVKDIMALSFDRAAKEKRLRQDIGLRVDLPQASGELSPSKDNPQE